MHGVSVPRGAHPSSVAPAVGLQYRGQRWQTARSKTESAPMRRQLSGRGTGNVTSAVTRVVGCSPYLATRREMPCLALRSSFLLLWPWRADDDGPLHAARHLPASSSVSPCSSSSIAAKAGSRGASRGPATQAARRLHPRGSVGSSGFPCGSSRWYSSTCHTRDHEENTQGRDGATSPAHAAPPTGAVQEGGGRSGSLCLFATAKNQMPSIMNRISMSDSLISPT